VTKITLPLSAASLLAGMDSSLTVVRLGEKTPIGLLFVLTVGGHKLGSAD